MSRVGKNPISLPKGVEIQTSGDTVTIKGAKASFHKNYWKEFQLN